MTKQYLHFLSMAALLGVAGVGCASIEKPRHHIKLKQDVTATVVGQGPKRVKAGDPVLIEETPVLVESPGFVSLLVIPGSRHLTQESEVEMRYIGEWGGREFDQRMNSALNDIVYEVNQVQTLLAASKGQSALAKAEELEHRYPKVTQIKYLKASCLVFLGRRNLAREVLQTAIRSNPRDQAGVELYQTLFGRLPASVEAAVRKSQDDQKKKSQSRGRKK